MSRGPLANHIPKCPKGFEAILWILLLAFQPLAFAFGCIPWFKLGFYGMWSLIPCLLGIGSALYILIAELGKPAAYNYWVVITLSTVNFILDKVAANGYAVAGLVVSQPKHWSPFILAALYSVQALLWLIYLIILAVAISKHRKAGGHSKYIPLEPNPRRDDTTPDPLHSTNLPLTREAPLNGYQQNLYQLGPVIFNHANSDNPPRLDSFGDPVEDERRVVGGEILNSHRTTPGNGSPVRHQEGICAVGGERTDNATSGEDSPVRREDPEVCSGFTEELTGGQGGEQVQIVITEERADCC